MAFKSENTAETLLRSKEHVQSHEDRISEQCNELVSKGNEAQSESSEVSSLEQPVVDLTARLNRSKAQKETYRALLKRVQATLALRKMMSRHPMANYVTKREKQAAKKTSLDVTSRRHLMKCDVNLSRLLTTPENETKRADEDANELKRLSPIENGLKAQL